MAVIHIHENRGMTRELYEYGHRELKLSSPPPGAYFQASGPMEGGGWRIIVVWESEEAADTFHRSEAFQQMWRNTQQMAQNPEIAQATITKYPLEIVLK